MKIREDDATARRERPLLVPGYHAVMEVLRRYPEEILELWISRSGARGRCREIETQARRHGIGIERKTPGEMESAFGEVGHQGLGALLRRFPYASLEHLTSQEKAQGERLFLAADHITDEGNLGAIIRTAVFFGVQGLILPRDRSARVGPGVIKRSAGACFLLPIARVINLPRALELLDARGFWIVGTSAKGATNLFDFDARRELVLVLGNEQKGLGPAVLKRCHTTVSIPGGGGMPSLNVSVACGILLAEVSRQRGVAH